MVAAQGESDNWFLFHLTSNEIDLSGLFFKYFNEPYTRSHFAVICMARY